MVARGNNQRGRLGGEKMNQWFCGKPRSKERIPKVLAELEELWSLYPDMRLGQLLLGCVSNEHVLFNIEDDELIQRLRNLLTQKGGEKA